MSYKTTKKIKFIVFNLLLLLLLYNIPVKAKFLENICLIKLITGKECWNCGMTRAFLSILHLDFYSAYAFNHNIVIVFPSTIGLYLYSWYKYILKKGEKRHERKR